MLIECDWPLYESTPDAIAVPVNLHTHRLDALHSLIQANDFTHAVVYADREHFANLHYLTSFDPRFEEALLILSPSRAPLILVGNECLAYLPISPLKLQSEVYQPFSLEDQPRDTSRTLEDILKSFGIGKGARIAAVGWKSYGDPRRSDIPSYIVDTLRDLAGPGAVENTTHWLTSARTVAHPYDIAIFERNNVKASDAMRRLQFALRPGITDHELLAQAVHYDGTPLSCHMSCKTGPRRISLASPSGNVIERGNTWSANIAYWGANICRANWVARDERDLPAPARDYLDVFAAPYFKAMAAWLETLRPGASCSSIYEAIHAALPQSVFHVQLNPGHYIAYDEWPGSPFYAGSTVKLASGTVLQSDVIPGHPTYFSTRMEDGYAILDATDWSAFGQSYPNAAHRIEQRQAFLRDTLGIEIDETLKPLSNTAGILAPWALSPRSILAMR